MTVARVDCSPALFHETVRECDDDVAGFEPYRGRGGVFRNEAEAQEGVRFDVDDSALARSAHDDRGWLPGRCQREGSSAQFDFEDQQSAGRLARIARDQLIELVKNGIPLV